MSNPGGENRTAQELVKKERNAGRRNPIADGGKKLYTLSLLKTFISPPPPPASYLLPFSTSLNTFYRLSPGPTSLSSLVASLSFQLLNLSPHQSDKMADNDNAVSRRPLLPPAFAMFCRDSVRGPWLIGDHPACAPRYASHNKTLLHRRP